MNLKKIRAPLITLAMLAAFANPAQANEEEVSLELNNATDHDGVCRLSFLVRNGLNVTVDDIGLEIVLLNKDGLAQNFLMLRTGTLISGKRRVRQFDLPDVSCSNLGEVLINDVADCQGSGLDAAACLAALKPSSKTTIKLGL